MKKLLLMLCLSLPLYCAEELIIQKSSLEDQLPQEVHNLITSYLEFTDIGSMLFVSQDASRNSLHAMLCEVEDQTDRAVLFSWLMHKKRLPATLAETNLHHGWFSQIKSDWVLLKGPAGIVFFNIKTNKIVQFMHDDKSKIHLASWHGAITPFELPVIAKEVGNKSYIDANDYLTHCIDSNKSNKLSPNGSMFITLKPGIGVEIYSTSDGKLLKTINAASDQLSLMLISENGKMLATAGQANVKIWDIETEQCLNAISNPNSAFNVSDSVFSRDGKYFAMQMVISERKINTNFKLWKIGTNEHFHAIDVLAPPAREIANAELCRNASYTLHISSDSKYIFTNSYSSIIIYDIAKQKPKANIRSVGKKRLALSPDGHFFAVSFDNGSIGIYNLANLRCLAKLLCENYSTLREIAFSADGKALLGLYEDGTLKIW